MDWVGYATIAGGFAAALGVIGGAGIAYLYSQKATVSVSATTYQTKQGLLIAVRPLISSSGIFAFRLAEKDGAVIEVQEIIFASGDRPRFGATLNPTAVFDSEFARGGETIQLTTTYAVVTPPPDLVGWQVEFKVQSRRFLRRGLYWADSIFVSIPG